MNSFQIHVLLKNFPGLEKLLPTDLTVIPFEAVKIRTLSKEFLDQQISSCFVRSPECNEGCCGRLTSISGYALYNGDAPEPAVKLEIPYASWGSNAGEKDYSIGAELFHKKQLTVHCLVIRTENVRRWLNGGEWTSPRCESSVIWEIYPIGEFNLAMYFSTKIEIAKQALVVH